MDNSTMTKPGREYSVSLVIWMMIYVALIALATWTRSTGAFSPPLLYLVALSPALPIGGVILALMRFIERSDEYVRALTTRRFILATGLTMFLCTAWGFLESFADAPSVPLWSVFPAFWALYGAACVVVPDRA
jgi:hypothetical protein